MYICNECEYQETEKGHLNSDARQISIYWFSVDQKYMIFKGCSWI